MTRQPKIHPTMHALLVENAIDNFSVIKLRNAALKLPNVDTEPTKLRQSIYRQLLLMQKKGWLDVNGVGRNKKYRKTRLFNETFNPSVNKAQGTKNEAEHLELLKKERNAFQGELQVLLGEVEFYEQIIQRLPTSKPIVSSLKRKSNEKAANLLGKVNAITNVIAAISKETKSC